MDACVQRNEGRAVSGTFLPLRGLICLEKGTRCAVRAITMLQISVFNRTLHFFNHSCWLRAGSSPCVPLLKHEFSVDFYVFSCFLDVHRLGPPGSCHDRKHLRHRNVLKAKKRSKRLKFSERPFEVVLK